MFPRAEARAQLFYSFYPSVAVVRGDNFSVT